MPARSQASMSSSPFWAVTSVPLTVIVTGESIVMGLGASGMGRSVLRSGSRR